MKEEKKLLIVTYYWPPSGGPGVQRWLKFCKYLVRLGYNIDVVTPDPDKANFPVRDESLQEDFLGRLTVHQTDNFDVFLFLKKFSRKAEYPMSAFANADEKLSWKTKLVRKLRSRLLIPDPRVFWVKHAVKKCKELIAESSYQAVITTSPPHSTQLVGLQLKEWNNDINWFVDFRDPWTDIFYYKDFFHSKRSANKDLGYEKKVIEGADKILIAAPGVQQLFVQKYGERISSKFNVITNGFDLDDFKEDVIPDKACYNITYTGTLAKGYKIESFIKALERITSEYDCVRLRMVGKIDKYYTNFIETSKVGQYSSFPGYVSHDEATEYMYSSNLLLLVIPIQGFNKWVIPGKIFEYIAVKRVVCNIGPTDSDPAKVLIDSNSGVTFDYHDEEGIYQFLSAKIEEWKKDGEYKIENKSSEYSREVLTNKLDLILKS